MSREDYRKARKEGLLHVKRAQSRGEDPYPAVLDQVLEDPSLNRKEFLLDVAQRLLDSGRL